jgi:hypothetical protein
MFIALTLFTYSRNAWFDLQRLAVHGFVAIVLATSPQQAFDCFLDLRDQVIEIESLSIDDGDNN